MPTPPAVRPEEWTVWQAIASNGDLMTALDVLFALAFVALVVGYIEDLLRHADRAGASTPPRRGPQVTVGAARPLDAEQGDLWSEGPRTRVRYFTGLWWR